MLKSVVAGLLLVFLAGTVFAQHVGTTGLIRIIPFAVWDNKIGAPGPGYFPPENAIDGNLTTRWSMRPDITGDPAELRIELGNLTIYPCIGVSIAWYKGLERQTTFDVHMGGDLVLEGEVSGLGSGYMFYPFNFPSECGTMRITTHGNDSTNPSTQPWNSIEDVKVWALP